MDGKHTVLIIWRGKQEAAYLEATLKAEGFETVTATDYAGASAPLSDTAVDVVLIEHAPPEIDGLEFLRSISAQKTAIPVLVMVPLDEREIAVFLKNGAFDVIRKTPDRSFVEKLPFSIRNALQLRDLCIADALTGMYNRRYIVGRMEEEFYESRRYNYEMSIMIIDVDNFKKVNDAYGHPAGDGILKEVAGVIKEDGRKSDIAGRYGGEEFVVIMPQTGKQEAVIAAERLRKKLKAYTFNALSKPVSLTVSVGVAALTEDMNIYDVDDLLKIADKALYAAKTAGKDKVVVL